jgi:hypothetical protein
MTDEELLASLKKADDLLGQYKEAIKPAAAELARRKSEAVYGKEGGYEGRLGCFEMGDNTLCLHLSDAFRQETFSEDKKFHDAALNFDHLWFHKAMDAGIKNIHISGFY